jgi:hypothetical protein
VTGIIYKIRNKENNNFYIGQTVRPLEERLKGHISGAKKNNTKIILQCAIRKYGKDSFEITPIVYADANNRHSLKFLLNVLEIKLISELNANNGINYNMTAGGDGITKGHKMEYSEEGLNRKIKRMTGINNPCYGKFGELSHTFGRKHYPETIEKLKSHKRTQEHCENISKSKKGKSVENHWMKNSENAKYISEIQKGKPKSESMKIKLSVAAKKSFENGRINPFKGKKHKEETKCKMREAKRVKREMLLGGLLL